MQTPRDRHNVRMRRKLDRMLKHHSPAEARLVVDSTAGDEELSLKWLS